MTDSAKPAKPEPAELSLTHDEERVYSILLQYGHAIGSDAILERLPDRNIKQLGAILNSLLHKSRIDAVGGAGSGGNVTFKAKSQEEVAKLVTMDVHEKMIYGHIKNAGNKGIWVKDLKQKSNIHSKIVQDAIKSLEKKQFIKSVKSVKNPIKKVYMLFELDPSEEVSGGTWYTDHEFDLEFITKVSEWVEKFIFKYSFPKGDPQLIFPPSYAKYPSLLKIVAAIEEYKVVNTALREEDVQVILDRLVFDGKIEKKLRTSGFGSDDEGDDLFVYKTIRDRFGKTTAWTDFPCGTCPVYDQCDDDGPITPMTCEYLTKWLATENAARDW